MEIQSSNLQLYEVNTSEKQSYSLTDVCTELQYIYYVNVLVVVDTQLLHTRRGTKAEQWSKRIGAAMPAAALEFMCDCHCRLLVFRRATDCARCSCVSDAEGGELESVGRRPPKTRSELFAFVRTPLLSLSPTRAAEWYARPTGSGALGTERRSSAFGVEDWRSDAQESDGQVTVETAHEALGQAHWRLVRFVRGIWHWSPDQPA